MQTYWVKVSVPEYYVVDAKTEYEAARKAVANYKKDFQTWQTPQVHEVKELTEDDLDAEAICEGASCKDELKYMRKYGV
jgi:hypothetical protein